MSVKTRLKLIILFVAVMALALVAGCSVGEPSLEDYLGERDAADQSVTYYANGGAFDDKSELVTKTIYYTENASVIDDFDKVTNISIARNGYVFAGWYLAELDESGKPVLDDNGNVKITDVKADLSTPIKKGTHLYVCARWESDIQLKIILVSDEPITVEGGTTYKSGDQIATEYFGTGNSIVLNTSKSPLESTTHTYLQYFSDEACTTPVETIAKPEGDDAEDPVIYAKYIKGDWTVVRSVNEVVRMLNALSSNTNYYLYDVTGSNVFDLKGKTTVTLKTGEFNSKIEGNGCTIKNLTISQTSFSAGYDYSIFGKATDSAEISNLTFEDISVSVTVRNGATVFALFISATSGVTFNNFAINGLTFNNNSATAMDTAHWMFGTKEEYTADSQFLEAHSGITVTGATLTNKQ
jgi:uncharacterized repeat protein (TIGR02543 family)